MLLAQTRRDFCSVRALNMKHTLEFVVIERYAMLFCQLRKWPPARMPGRVYRPVRPLVLIYNSMDKGLYTHVVWYRKPNIHYEPFSLVDPPP